MNSANTSIQDLSTDLDGKKICVGSSTTYEDYLKGTLVLGAAAPPFDFVIDDPTIITYGDRHGLALTTSRSATAFAATQR